MPDLTLDVRQVGPCAPRAIVDPAEQSYYGTGTPLRREETKMPTGPDIYGGRDPRDIPAYPVAEAALYLRVSQSTLRYWLRPETRTGRSPVIAAARHRPCVLSFYNLIEVHVLRALRTDEEISLQRIRRALRYVEDQFKVTRPLLNQDFETNGLDLFVERLGKTYNVSQGGVIVMRRAVADTLRRIDRDEKGLAQRFFLWVRDPLEERAVSVDPRIAFGRAVLKDTAIPITLLAGRSRGGDSAQAIANDYDVSVAEVETALQWEPRAKAA